MLDFSPYRKDIARLFQDGLDLERLRDKTILVVGATGLVGGCVVDVLMQNPARCYKVIAAGRNKERAQQKFAAYWEDESFFFAKIDVTQPVIKSMNGMMVESAYDELAKGADYIIDAASNASPNFFSREPVEVMKANINGVSHLIEYGLKHRMKRMVYVSSEKSMAKAMVLSLPRRAADMWIVPLCVPAIHRRSELQRHFAWHTELSMMPMW